MANKKSVTETADNVTKIEGFEHENFAEWVETIGGFPPYWQPLDGRTFLGRPVMFDMRDPEFPRVVFQAEAPLDCERGKVGEAETVTVQKGELFTVAMYKSLEDFVHYIGIPVLFQAVEKVQQKGDSKKSFWKFSAKVNPTDAKLISDRKLEETKMRLAERRGVPLATSGNTEVLPAAAK